jgi:hypothetical protein
MPNVHLSSQSQRRTRPSLARVRAACSALLVIPYVYECSSSGNVPAATSAANAVAAFEISPRRST